MREIKFRAWDNDKMYKCIVGNTDVKDNDYICPLVWDKERKDWLHSDTCKIMQYTGLKDKNGKEIYEGDILLYLTKTKTVVSYKNGAFVRNYRNSNMYLLYDTLAVDGCLEDYEVIGNIYENPELLEGEE